VEEIITAEGIEKDHLLRQAACVEQNSTHPLAKAVLKAIQNARLTVGSEKNLLAESGRGVTGCIDGCQVQVGNILRSAHSCSFPENLKKEHERIIKRGLTPCWYIKTMLLLGLSPYPTLSGLTSKNT
jgi:Zn2+/Cd2+-exporting ATPase